MIADVFRAQHNVFIFRKPASKRPNYAVVGTRFPFAPNWRYLCSSENETQKDEQTTPVIGDNILLSDDLKQELTTDESRKRPLVERNGEEPVSKIAKLDEFSFLPRVIRDKSKINNFSQLLQCHDNGKNNIEKIKDLVLNYLMEYISCLALVRLLVETIRILGCGSISLSSVTKKLKTYRIHSFPA